MTTQTPERDREPDGGSPAPRVRCDAQGNCPLESRVSSLEAANAALESLLDASDTAKLFFDTELYLRRFTSAASALLGLDTADVGRPLAEVVGRIDDPSLLDDTRRVLAGEVLAPREVGGGTGRWYLRRLLPARPGTPAPIGAVLTLTDITERKQAELALARSEQRLRRITDAVPALISYLDPELRYRFNNAAYRRWFGLEPSALRGRYVADLLGDRVWAVVGPRLQRALAGEEVSYDDWLPFEQGGSRHCRVQYIPDRLENGEVAGLFVLVNDMTERRRSEEAIERLHAENAARLKEMQVLFDAAPIGIFVSRDPECRDMQMNRSGARMLRIDDGANPSLSGPNAAELPFRFFHQGRELRDEELPMHVAARTGRRVDGFEEELHFSDGEIKSLVAYAAPLADDAGRIYGCVGTFADVTRRREEERRYREDLAEADRRKDEFLSMLGHELRNPLASLRGALDVLTVKRDDAGTLDWACGLIDRQLRHLQRLVDDLLDVARITRGAITLKTGRLDLADALREALESVDGLMQERHHRVTAELPLGPVPVEGDGTRLVQVFVNLLNNAANYTSPGGTIRIVLSTGEGQARASVEDTGHGIEHDMLPHVFDTFRRGRAGAGQPASGLGLGLSLVRQLVTMHGGTVTAASDGPARGSRFVVTLPLVEADSAPATAVVREGAEPAAAPRRRRVLVVDDVADIRESSTMLLEMLGHEVASAATGREALDAVERARPDVILLDVGLQDMDGIEVARQLAQRPDRAAFKVVILSGYTGNSGNAANGLVDGQLLKPVDLASLKAALD